MGPLYSLSQAAAISTMPFPRDMASQQTPPPTQ